MAKEIDRNGEKFVELPFEEFKELVSRYKRCAEQRKQLIRIVNFLNEEIEEYNKRFAEKNDGKA